MFYLSQLVGLPVEDLQSVRLGKLIDVLVQTAQVGQHESTYPSTLLVEGQTEQLWRVPGESVEWHEHVLHLRVPLEQLEESSPTPLTGELSLVREVLDKQVIDVVRKKAVRVNDVCMSEDGALVGIDNSTLGLVRRLAPSWLLGTNRKRSPANLIPWEHIELIGGQLAEVAEPGASDVEEAEDAINRVPTAQPRVSGHLVRTPSGHLAELHP